MYGVFYVRTFLWKKNNCWWMKGASMEMQSHSLHSVNENKYACDTAPHQSHNIPLCKSLMKIPIVNHS